MTLRHVFESPVTDANDPDLVGPDEWNDIHREDPRRGSFVFEECYYVGSSGYHGGIGSSSSGTGAAASDGFSAYSNDTGVGTGIHHPGIVAVSTGTTTTGRCGLMATQGLTGGHVMLYTGGVRFGITQQVNGLSTGTDRYTVRCGLGLTNTGDGTDAVWFRYTDNVNSGKWQAVTRESSNETAVDTGVAPITDPWQTLEFVVADDASEIEFFIDGASVATISTNLPSDVGLSFVPANIIKSAGTQARSVSIDAYWYGFDIRSR